MLKAWSAQDFFAFTSAHKPRWIFNFHTANSEWKAVPFCVLPPCCNKSNVKGAVLMRTGEDSDLLSHAVKTGIFLTVPQIKQVYLANKWPYPGASNRKKQDFVFDLIARLHPKASEDEKSSMAAALQGLTKGKKAAAGSMDQDQCADTLLHVISNLDPENADAAKGLRKECVNRLLDKRTKPPEEDLKPARTAAPGTPAASEKDESESRGGWQKHNFTPTELRALLPPTSGVCWIKRQPAVSQYAGYYERDLARSLHMLLFLFCPSRSPECVALQPES